MPLPVVPTRARRGTRTGSFPPVVAAESKPSEVVPPVTPVSNLGVKAHECEARDESPAPAGRGRRGSTPELARFQAAVQRLKSIVSERPGAEGDRARPGSPIAQKKIVEQDVQEEAPKPSAPVEVPEEAPADEDEEAHDDTVPGPEAVQEISRLQLTVMNNVSTVPAVEPVTKEVEQGGAEIRFSEEEDGSKAEAWENGLVGLVKETVLSPVPEEAEPTIEAKPFPNFTELPSTTVAEETDVDDDHEFVGEPSGLGIVSLQRVKVARSIDDLVSRVAETAEVFTVGATNGHGLCDREPSTPVRQTRFEEFDFPRQTTEEESGLSEQAKQIAAPELRTEPPTPQRSEDNLEDTDLDEETNLHDHNQVRTPTDWPLRWEEEEAHGERHVLDSSQDGEEYCAPVQSIVRTQLTRGGSTTDTDSQVFVTPLASAGFRSPPSFEQPKTLGDGLNNDGDGNHYQGDDHDYASQVTNPYQLREEQATTVHGQDNLFDYDDDQSIDARSHSPFSEHDVESAAPREPVLGEAAEIMPHDKDSTVLLSTTGADATKADWTSETSDSPSTLETPSQTQTDTANTTPLSPPLGSPLSHKGLSASRHNPERPETPPQQRHHFYATPETDIQPRDVTDIPWHSRNTSTPQSLHSQSTLESSPFSSPVQHHSHHDPVIRHSWSTGSGRQRGDSVLTQNSYSDAKEWRQREIAVEEITPSTNTLFQRMRNVFEQPATRARSASPVWGKGSNESPSRKRMYQENEQEEEADERSTLLGSISTSG